MRNRYTQVVAPVGDLSVSYTAEVDLDIFRADPADELARIMHDLTMEPSCLR
jgi:hypothetical protein